MDHALTTPAHMPDKPKDIPAAAAVKRPVKLKGIALPTEHGSWGIVFEPIVAALAVAFSIAGVFVSIAFVGAFLMRQPLKVLLAERAAGRRMPQGEVARRYIAIFAAIFVVGAIGSILYAPAHNFLPLVLAAPLAAIQIYYDSARQSRKLAPELAGAIAISSSAAVIALAGGWTAAAAAALWIVLVCRAVPSIFYVRERLLMEKGKPFVFYSPVLFAAAAALFTVALAICGLGPWLAAVMMAFLLLRAAVGLSRFSKRRKAMQLGVFEVVFGAVTVLAIILGYLLHL